MFTIAHSLPNSIVSTPGIRSRCGSGVVGSVFSGSLYDVNNNIYEELPVPPSTPTGEVALPSTTLPWNIDEADSDHSETDKIRMAIETDSMCALSVMSEIQTDDVTKMLNEVNDSIQKEN